MKERHCICLSMLVNLILYIRICKAKIMPRKVKEIMPKKSIIFDIESFENYFLCLAHDTQTGEFWEIERAKDLHQWLSTIKNRYGDDLQLVGFNNHHYDDPMIKVPMILGFDSDKQCNDLSNKIINSGLKPWEISKIKKAQDWEWKNGQLYLSIDLKKIQTSSLKNLGLKQHASRMRHFRLQDLPYSPDTILTPKQKLRVKTYCYNDIAITVKLWNMSHKAVDIRRELAEMFGLDVSGAGSIISDTEPKVAEKVMLALYGVPKKSLLKSAQARYKELCDNPYKVKDCFTQEYKFETPEFQKKLEEFSEMIIDVSETSDTSISLVWELRGKEFSIALGGIHQLLGLSFHVADKIFKMILSDVGSMYPAIICKDFVRPSFCTKKLVQIYHDIMVRRLEAKKSGDKITASCLKIVLNSFYGSFGYKYSPFFDKKAMHTVTINGQLKTLVLLEKLILAGFEILSTNTDGILVKVPREKEAEYNSILSKWEKWAGLVMENEEIETFFARDVNNYGIIYPNGKTKGKGALSTSTTMMPYNIIPMAILEYFSKGINVFDFMEAELNKPAGILEFTKTFKASKNYTIYFRDKPQQKLNRFYRSKTSEHALMKLKAGKQKFEKVANSENCNLINDLDESLKSDVDVNWYGLQALELIDDIKNNHLRFEWAEELRKLDLTPIPKNGKKNISGAKLSMIREDWKFNQYRNVGVYTGESVDTVVIDIDKPKLVDPLFLGLLEKSNTMVISKTESDPGRVSYVFRCDSTELKFSGKTFLPKYGFEVLYGNTTATTHGYYDRIVGSKYKISGVPGKIPSNILKALISKSGYGLKKSKKRKRSEKIMQKYWEKLEAFSIKNPYEDLENQIPEILFQIAKKIGICGKLIKKRDSIEFRSHCPFEENHTGKNHWRDFVIKYYKSSKSIGVHCSHTSCNDSAEVNCLTSKILKMWEICRQSNLENEKKTIETLSSVLSRTTITLNNGDSIYNTYTDVCKRRNHTIISAPCGGGKTYSAAKLALQHIIDGKKMVFVGSLKTDMHTFERYLREMILAHDIPQDTYDAAVQIICHEDSTEQKEGDEISGSKVSDNKLIVITHHHYLLRKGISKDLYTPIWKWLEETKENITMLIDEAEAFVKKLHRVYNLSERYRRVKDGSNYKLIKAPICLLESKSGNCSNCVQKCFKVLSKNKYGVLEWIDISHNPIEGLVTEQDSPINVSDLSFTSEAWIDNEHIREIETNTNYRYSRDLSVREVWNSENENENKGTPADIFNDIIQCSHNPKLVSSSMIFDGTPITQSKLLEYVTQEYGYWEKTKKKHQFRSKLQKPYRSCITALESFDMLPFLKIESLPNVQTIWTSATISENSIEIIGKNLKGVDIKTIEGNRNEIEKINILFSDTPITWKSKKYGHFTKFLEDHNVPTLKFFGKKSKCKKAFSILGRDWQKVKMLDDQGVSVKLKYSDTEKESPTTTMTYSYGPYSEGVNRKDDVLAIIDCRAAKPLLALNLQKYSPEEFKTKQLEDLAGTMIQNAGRILRGSGTKTIFFYNCQEDLRKIIIEKFKSEKYVSNENLEIKIDKSPKFEDIKDDLLRATCNENGSFSPKIIL